MEATIDTPLGRVGLACGIAGWENADSAAVSEVLSPAYRCTSWSGPVGSTLQLIVVDLPLPEVIDDGTGRVIGVVDPAGGVLGVDEFEPITGNVGVVWRLVAKGPTPPWSLSVRHRGSEGGTDCGEDLQAVTFDCTEFRMTIGTHDDEALANRADPVPAPWLRCAPLPPRWRDRIGDSGQQGEFGATSCAEGIDVRLPGLLAGESAMIHFAIAWGPKGSDQNAAARFAVDTTPDRILAAANLPEREL